ncbi:MAG: anhydro-N-acetylmuramic acid kinase [Acidobacteriota bacterium]|nr:anhydro-N-acetylmuramic acid kinase [Acidobacteriota bacterium]
MMQARTMIVAGVMSGTSVDGVDVALCRIRLGKDGVPGVKVLGHVERRFPPRLRSQVLAAVEGAALPASAWSRLHWQLGALYAESVERASAALQLRPALVGCHGQTVFHGASQRLRSTWQMGEASVLTERLRIPVVSDFRPADLAAGGQGAPLVPLLDWVLFRSAQVARVLQNLGGIGNLTAIPAGAGPDRMLAFDTGPGNMVIDACMQRLYGKPLDRDGAVARRGAVQQAVVDRILRGRYFSAPPPKSCGREQYGASFVDEFVGQCRRAKASDADVIATATALTAESVLLGFRRLVAPHLIAPHLADARMEFCVSGGGARNTTLMSWLRAGLARDGVRLRALDELGVAPQAKEAVAFALLAWLTWHGLPGNVPAATGAARPVVLGRVSQP